MVSKEKSRIFGYSILAHKDSLRVFFYWLRGFWRINFDIATCPMSGGDCDLAIGAFDETNKNCLKCSNDNFNCMVCPDGYYVSGFDCIGIDRVDGIKFTYE